MPRLTPFNTGPLDVPGITTEDQMAVEVVGIDFTAS